MVNTSPDDFSLTVIVPTISRPSLGRTLLSLLHQPWRRPDVVLVLPDGNQPRAKQLSVQFPARFKYVRVPWREPKKDQSHTPRNWVLHEVGLSTTHFTVLDDDDVWTPDALELIRTKVSLAPAAMHLFRMDGRNDPRIGKILWEDKEVRKGNVGTPMSVCPFDDHVAKYEEQKYGGDFTFIKSESETHEVVWHEEVTTILTPPVL